jgi:hypothetical protein
VFRLYKKEDGASGLVALDFPGSYQALGRRRRFAGYIIASSFVILICPSQQVDHGLKVKS